MISNIGAFNAYSYNAILGNTGSSKLQIPVQPGLVVYSQLEHISGVAAKQNQSGVNITKIQILNTLIDQLVSLKKKPDQGAKPDTLTGDQVDTLIKNYQNQIQTAIKTAEANPFAPAGVSVQPGALFSLSV
ncbi:hypothetical protein [Treponema brennaborense]|uniref:Uncharacterized protein n=1 Tax=Treponema brennaborense (strain DSM 12168 / CIP 105900 / DD5/3) TaxID=906968 RepID=F4LK54_TREBD|nr:hypothetical protein [Treponema brennaborense]AEE17516.1 hypothetical protein Trebr_2101 [Treponema brennaborense DSM 12168]